MKSYPLILFLLTLLSVGCGEDATAPNSPADTKTDILVPQGCLEQLPPLKEDCLLLLSETEFIYMDKQADVDLICNSSCTAAGMISVGDRSNSEALKVLRRLTYIKSASIHGTSLPDASVFSRLERAGILDISSQRESFSLHGLENLKTVEINLSIESEELKDLQGLNNLETVGKFFDQKTMKLYDGGTFDISSNFGLETLDGLESLKEVGQLYLAINVKLRNIDGLSSLRRVNNSIAIGKNRKLTSLKGLEGVETLTGSLVIDNNDALPQCQATELLERVGGIEALGSRAEVRIHDNLVTAECF